ncbi:MAG: helix-turn-helix transcriptional regulator [Pseudomonadota bacterium]
MTKRRGRGRESSANTPLARIRTERGLTLEQLSERAGMSVSVLSRLEHDGQYRMPHIEALTRALGVTIPELLGLRDGAPTMAFAEPDVQRLEPQETAQFGSAAAGQALSETQSYYRAKTGVLDRIGIRPGDIVIIDIGDEALRKVPDGAAVLANIYAGDDASAITVMRQWLAPSLLVTNSHSRALPPIDLEHVDGALMAIVAYVVQVQLTRPGPQSQT